VDRIDRRIAQDVSVIGRYRRDGKALAQVSRRLCVSACDRGHLYGFDPPHCFQMHAAHEASAEDCYPD
jgi:hypothetical protein